MGDGLLAVPAIRIRQLWVILVFRWVFLVKWWVRISSLLLMIYTGIRFDICPAPVLNNTHRDP